MLVIDIGNTTTKAALFFKDTIASRVQMLTREVQVDTFSDLLSDLFGDVGDSPAGMTAAVSSVVPDAEEEVISALEYVGMECAVPLAANRLAVMPTSLDEPETVGVDRLLAARAGHEMYGARIVIQAGSAITIDSVDDNGVFRGGLILPGPVLWLDSFAFTALVPAFDARKIYWEKALRSPLGDNTESAVANGLAVGLTSAINGAVDRIRQGAAENLKTVITGGWAEVLQPVLGNNIELAPDLVLHGARMVGEELASL